MVSQVTAHPWMSSTCSSSHKEFLQNFEIAGGLPLIKSSSEGESQKSSNGDECACYFCRLPLALLTALTQWQEGAPGPDCNFALSTIIGVCVSYALIVVEVVAATSPSLHFTSFVPLLSHVTHLQVLSTCNLPFDFDSSLEKISTTLTIRTSYHPTKTELQRW